MTRAEFMKAVKTASEEVHAQKPRRKEHVVATTVQVAAQRGLYRFEVGGNPDEDPVIILIAGLAGSRMDFANIRHDPNPDVNWRMLQLLEEAWEAFDARQHAGGVVRQTA